MIRDHLFDSLQKYAPISHAIDGFSIYAHSIRRIFTPSVPKMTIPYLSRSGRGIGGKRSYGMFGEHTPAHRRTVQS
jgi:hypothetical protein